jgi:EpsI family protein
VNRVTIAKGLDRQLVLYWYQSHRRVVASEYWGKVYTVLDSVRYNRTDAALVRVVTPLLDGEPVEAVERRAVAFVQSLFPLLPRHLPS